MIFGISDEVINDIKCIFAQHPIIEQVYIFGSQAKGTFSPDSDIDLVIMVKPIIHDEYLQILSKLDELELIYKIDLLDYSKIQEPALKEHIDRVGQTFYLKIH